MEIEYSPKVDKVRLWDKTVVEIGDPSNFIANVLLYCGGTLDSTYKSANAILKAVGHTARFEFLENPDGTVSVKSPEGIPPVGWFLDLYGKVRQHLKDLEKNPKLTLANPLEPSYVPLAETIALPDGKSQEIRDILEFYANVNADFDGQMFYHHAWADRVRIALGKPVVNGNPEMVDKVLPVGWCLALMEAVAKKVQALVQAKKN